MTKVILAFGSNLGARQRNLSDALRAIESFVRVKKASPVYSSVSLLEDGQPDYLNAAVSGHTSLSPSDLLEEVTKTETLLGRVRNTGRWGARIIDIDIIDYGGLIIDLPGLRAPHPRIAERSFVLYPLRDVDPGYVHPETGLSVDTMIGDLKNDLGLRRIGPPLP